MHSALPALNALRAFEAAARHLSMTKAAEELSVTPGALSHQIRGLEEFLGIKLFERKVRAITLTPAGRLLYPGLQSGFAQIRDAVTSLHGFENDKVLVVSTPPGFTAKWLAPRLYKFSNANPEIDIRVSSSLSNANFVTDGVHMAIRNLPNDHAPFPGHTVEKLIGMNLIPVCSPDLASTYGPLDDPRTIAQIPLIHDETLVGKVRLPGWPEVFKAAGLEHGAVDRGLRFNAADHALDAAVEGAGLLLTHSILAADDLRTGRLIAPLDVKVESGRGYYLLYPDLNAQRANVVAFRRWITDQMKELNSMLSSVRDATLIGLHG